MDAFGPESLSRNTKSGNIRINTPSSDLAGSVFGSFYDPKSNIVIVDKTNYYIEMAVPGFLASDLDIERKSDRITVSGNVSDAEPKIYMEKGFEKRAFRKTFTLKNENSLVKKVTLFNGVLTIYIEDVVPEAEKPKKIDITVL